MAETLKLTPTESVTIRSHEPHELEIEVSYAAGGTPPPAHHHPAQDEHFEVLEGSIAVQLDGEQRRLETGEQIEIPRGTPHQMWNPHESPARVRWRTMPAGRTA